MFLLLVPPVIIPMLKRRERSSAIPVMTLAHSSGQQAAIYRLEKIMQNTNLWTGGDVWLMHDYLSINICTWTVITIDYSTWFNYTQWLKIVKISHLPTKNQHQKLQILVQKLDFWWKLVKLLICIFALKIKILALKLRKTTKIESYLCVECKAGMNFCVLQFHRRRGVKDNFTTCGDTFLRFQVFEEKKRAGSCDSRWQLLLPNHTLLLLWQLKIRVEILSLAPEWRLPPFGRVRTLLQSSQIGSSFSRS